MASVTRVYLGNLASNLTEKDLQNYLKNFGPLQDICIKHRKDHTGNVTSSFAHVSFSENKGNLQECIDFLNHQTWNGNQVKAEIAKETYLKRMAARCQDTTEKLESNCKSPEHMKSPQTKKQKKTTRLTNKKSNDSIKKEDSGEESDNEIFWKKGSNAHNVVTLESEEPRKPTLASKTNNGNSLLQKFESFSSVWNDDGSNSDAMFSNIFPSKRNFTEKHIVEDSSQSFSKNKKVIAEKSEEIPFQKTQGVKTLPKTSKKQQGEEKRLQSLKDRMNTFQTRQDTVRKALAGEPVNKRIKFDSEEIGKSLTENPQLFEEDDSDGDNTNDFAVRKQFEGKHGEKLLELQSKFTTDERFRLDSRFAEESDSDKEEDFEGHENENNTEQMKQLSIIDSILGPDQIITSKHLQKKQGMKAIVRYDPSKPEHSKKYLNNVEMPKKRNKHEEEKEESAATETPLPAVSHEQFYEISESLQTTLLPGASNAFSLRSLFGEGGDAEPFEEDNEKTVISEQFKAKTKKTFGLDKDPSSEKLDDSIALQNTCSIGTWQEPFFFKPDDVRFEEGITFFKAAVCDSKENFDRQRHVLLKSVKNKLNVVAKKKMTFERKLGGRSSKKYNMKVGKKKN